MGSIDEFQGLRPIPTSRASSARRFIFSEDLSTGGSHLSSESLGPKVVKPGEAVVLHLESMSPDIESFRDSDDTKKPDSGIHIGVAFSALTPSGELREEDKIFCFTEMQYNGYRRIGNKPRTGNNKSLIDLL